MVSIRSALCFAAGIFALSAQAQDLSPRELGEVRARFEQRQAQGRTAGVPFTQRLRMPGMRNPATSRGRILFAAPNRIRLDYDQPAGDLLLLPGDGTLVLRKGSRPASVKPLARLDARTQRNLELLLSLFTGRLPEAAAGNRLSARREGARLTFAIVGGDGESVETLLTWPTLDPVAVRVTLPGGGEIHYEFAAVDRRPNLPADAFAAP